MPIGFAHKVRLDVRSSNGLVVNMALHILASRMRK